MTRSTAFLPLALCLLSVFASARAEAAYTTPLGIALEGWPYPWPVKLLDLDLEGPRERMAYMDVAPTGRANGRTVTLLHGKNFFGAYWEGTARALAAAGYRVVIPDQIGFGKSSKPAIDYSFDLLAANTAHLLDTLGIEKTAVVGHSMGGMLAVRFARNYPERTTHLVLENPIGLEDYRFKIPPQTTEKALEKELAQTEEKIRAYIKTYPAHWNPAVFEPFVEVPSRVLLSGEYPRWARASALTYQMIYRQPVRYEFPLLRVPTLLVIGQADRTAVGKDLAPPEVRDTLGRYPELGRAAAKDIPGARLVELDDVGHIPHLEAPERFHQALLDFLGR
jgi:pimeloyl-ACP methyl ester carboxylesterase